MGVTSLTICLLLTSVVAVFGYQLSGAEKETYLTDAFLREMAQHMGRDLSAANGYFEPVGSPSARYIGSRNMKGLEDDDASMAADLELEGLSPPSLRDREFLQHSSLWSSQLLGDGGGSGSSSQRLSPGGSSLVLPAQLKTDPTLPAYCNPPNPCPVGYTAEDGCLEDFENTAAFSRKYQAMQDCMCDSEHMFDCPLRDEGADYDTDLDFLNELTMQDHHKALVAKKFHAKKSGNPFLEGEKLPIAAKKGLKLE